MSLQLSAHPYPDPEAQLGSISRSLSKAKAKAKCRADVSPCTLCPANLGSTPGLGAGDSSCAVLDHLSGPCPACEHIRGQAAPHAAGAGVRTGNNFPMK